MTINMKALPQVGDHVEVTDFPPGVPTEGIQIGDKGKVTGMLADGTLFVSLYSSGISLGWNYIYFAQVADE